MHSPDVEAICKHSAWLIVSIMIKVVHDICWAKFNHCVLSPCVQKSRWVKQSGGA